MKVSRAGTGAGSRRARSVRRPGVLAVLAAAAVVCTGLLSGAGAAWGVSAASDPGAAAARVHWGRAEPVPGLAALNKGVNGDVNFYITASVTAISCWGAGGCVAGGFYADRHEHLQAFVARERRGRWGKAIEVPGTAALNLGGNAQVTQVACARTSVCVAVGRYTNQGDGGEYFTVTERNGRWGTAAPVPVPPLNGVGINAAWCAPGGLCAAGGGFTDAGGATQVWVETETHGRWQPALEVPGIAALNVGGNLPGGGAGVQSVSCASAGNCAVGGNYASAASDSTNGFPPLQPFVATETNGTWGAAQEVPGIEAINNIDWADGETTFIACPSAGNCTAAGTYQDGSYDSGCDQQCWGTFVVNERHGTWGQVKATWIGYPFTLTCPAAGDCVAGGAYVDSYDNYTAELISETNDHWVGPRLIASIQQVNSVSCASEGYCAAGGTNGGDSAFVMSEWHGTWGKAVTPAGLPARYNVNGPGGATVRAVACPPKVTLCVAGGNQTPANGNRAQAFIVSQAR
ncbi:MAG: hypothetical protein ACLQFR_18130 [Streptosporangiaceae bacterium]